VVSLLREAGGDLAVDLVRQSLVGDGTVSPAEWTEYVGDGPGRGA
jgi:hypothetical protein